MNRHLVLVGLPGAGKTTVGRLVAGELGVECIDIDEAIEYREGCSVAEIITQRGESEFRRLEKMETTRAICGPVAVVVPGAGWAAEEGNLEDISEFALTIHLETTASTATERVGESGNRPLLIGPDPESLMKELLKLRLPFYTTCEAAVSTEGKAPGEIANEIVELAQGAAAG